MKKLVRSLTKIGKNISLLGFTITFMVGFVFATSMFWLFGKSIKSLMAYFIL